MQSRWTRFPGHRNVSESLWRLSVEDFIVQQPGVLNTAEEEEEEEKEGY